MAIYLTGELAIMRLFALIVAFGAIGVFGVLLKESILLMFLLNEAMAISFSGVDENLVWIEFLNKAKVEF